MKITKKKAKSAGLIGLLVAFVDLAILYIQEPSATLRWVLWIMGGTALFAALMFFLWLRVFPNQAKSDDEVDRLINDFDRPEFNQKMKTVIFIIFAALLTVCFLLELYSIENNTHWSRTVWWG